jgi:hypothetical protein
MAKQRPTLGTYASPVGGPVAPIQQQAAPLDEKAIRDTYAFADAFGDFSQSMVQLASVLKTQSNKEEFEKGRQMILGSRKTYADLEKAGEIRPIENPWLAVGAQQASGILEAASSANEIRDLVSKASSENPEFLDDPKHFDALVASYAQNKTAQYGTQKYLADSFFENFNPVVLKLQEENFEAIEENRLNKAVQAATAKVRLSVDMVGPQSTEGQISDLQASFDEAVANSGGRASEISQAYAVSLIEIMRTDPEGADAAKMLLESLKAGTGRLVDTSVAKNLLFKHGPQIAETRRNATFAETREIFDKQVALVAKYESGLYGEGPEAHKKVIDEFDNFAKTDISINAAKTEAERDYLYRKIQAVDSEKARLREDLIKQAEEADKKAAAEAENYRKQLLADTRIKLREQVRTGSMHPAVAMDRLTALLNDPASGYTASERLAAFKESETDFSGVEKDYEDSVALRRVSTANDRIASEVSGQVDRFVSEVSRDMGTTARPVDIPRLRAQMSEAFRAAGLNEEQRTKARDALYSRVSTQTREDLTRRFTVVGPGNFAPANLADLNPAPTDTPQLRTYKANARATINDAMVSLDEAFDAEDQIAYFRDVANTSLTPSVIEQGVPPEVIDLFRMWKESKSGYFRDKLFSSPAGERLNILFTKVDASNPSDESFQDALSDAVSDFAVGQGAAIVDWTKITQTEAADRKAFEDRLRYLIEELEISMPDARRLVENMYGSEVVRQFQTSGENPLNLSRAIKNGAESLKSRVLVYDGTIVFREGALGQGSFGVEHLRNLAKFYAPNSEGAVFFPIDRLANGTHLYALRSPSGDIIQNRVFTLEQLSGQDALMRSEYRRNTGKSEKDWIETRTKGQYIDYSNTFEAQNNRRRDLLVPPTEAQ